MLKRVPPSDEAEKKEVPEFIEVCCSLKTVYNHVQQKLNESHQQNKTRLDRRKAGNTLHVGDKSVALCACHQAGKNQEACIAVAWTIYHHGQNWCCELPNTANWIYQDTCGT